MVRENYKMNENEINSTNKDENKKSVLPYIVIGVCAIAALAVGFIVGRNIAKNKEIVAAQEYLDWESQNHTWVEATCQSPKTCSVCGLTEGEVGEHEWEEATCEAPRTCKLCGATEGEPLEHDWKMATLEAPKTCKHCGATEGDKLELIKLDFSFLPEDTTYHIYPGEMRNLWISRKDYFAEVRGDAVEASHNLESGKDELIFACTKHNIFPDQNSEVVRDLVIAEVPLSNSAVEWHFAYAYTPDYFVLGCGETGKDVYLFVFNENMDQIGEPKIIDDSINGILHSNDQKLFMIYNEKDECIWVYDTDQNKWIDGSEYDLNPFSNNDPEPDFDKSEYSNVLYQSVFDGFMVGSQDGWGYLDKSGNEIAMYKDATEFSDNGYALVSDDGKTYDLIDKDFNVISKDIFEGISAYTVPSYNWFGVKTADGTEIYYKIECPEEE